MQQFGGANNFSKKHGKGSCTANSMTSKCFCKSMYWQRIWVGSVQICLQWYNTSSWHPEERDKHEDMVITLYCGQHLVTFKNGNVFGGDTVSV